MFAFRVVERIYGPFMVFRDIWRLALQLQAYLFTKGKFVKPTYLPLPHKLTKDTSCVLILKRVSNFMGQLQEKPKSQ